MTDLLDHTAYPAKATLTGAGLSAGPILRSTTPATVRQEMRAWLTATTLVRAAACHAARSTPTPPITAWQLSFTTAVREIIRSVGRVLLTATSSAAARAATTACTAAALLARPVQVDRHRHRPRVTKTRHKFPPATGAATTGAGQVTIHAPASTAMPSPRPPADPHSATTPPTSKT